MTTTFFTPQASSIFNEYDETGLLLGLSRLENERNPAYKKRLLDVMVHRANSTKKGLLYGITRELGLSISRALTISCVLDGNGNPLLPHQAVVFDDPNCVVYSDYSAGTILTTIDRFDPTKSTFNINGLVTAINATGYFTATLFPGIDENNRAMTIFDQGTAGIVDHENIDKGSNHIRLDYNHLIEGTIAIRSSNLTNRVYTEVEIVNPGDYYIDLTNGIIYSASVPENGSAIRYEYINLVTIVESSPVILHSLQSEAFQDKLYYYGSLSSGWPTPYGAEIINELLSVYPATWSK